MGGQFLINVAVSSPPPIERESRVDPAAVSEEVQAATHMTHGTVLRRGDELSCRPNSVGPRKRFVRRCGVIAEER
jgi:hypothetical protein